MKKTLLLALIVASVANTAAALLGAYGKLNHLPFGSAALVSSALLTPVVVVLAIVYLKVRKPTTDG